MTILGRKLLPWNLSLWTHATDADRLRQLYGPWPLCVCASVYLCVYLSLSVCVRVWMDGVEDRLAFERPRRRTMPSQAEVEGQPMLALSHQFHACCMPFVTFLLTVRLAAI